jgi:heat shock protein HslJ
MKTTFERLISGAILLLILLLVGCGQAAAQDATPSLAPMPDATLPVAASATPVQDPLAGTKWVLLSLRGEHLLEGSRITIEFSGGFVRGFAGCNNYDRLVIGDDVARGKYKATEDGDLTIPGLTITELGCPAPEGVMDQEKAYLEALRSAAAYRLVEDRLEIQNVAGETILVYTRRAQSAEELASLAGTAWQLVLVNGEVPVGGSITTLAFLDEKWFVEYSRCEGYVSSYQTADHDLSVDYSAWLGRVCQDEEGLGVTMLGEPSDFGLMQGRLQITMVSGRPFVYEPLPQEAQLALEGPTWSLLSIVGERWIEGWVVPMPDPIPILEGSEITLILKGGMGSGSAGCNAYGSAYTLDGISLAFGDVVATERDCPIPVRVMEQERRYLNWLKGARRSAIYGSQLWLETGDGRSLVFAGSRP